MEFIINMMVALGALAAAAYCMLLSRRLRALTRLDGDIGKAIAILSQQVDALSRALQAAEKTSAQSNVALEQQISRADATARRLELLMAAHQTTDKRSIAEERRSNPDIDEPYGSDRPNADFAPFGRHAQRTPADTRTRVLRQRDPLGVDR